IPVEWPSEELFRGSHAAPGPRAHSPRRLPQRQPARRGETARMRIPLAAPAADESDRYGRTKRKSRRR
ncbi:MAG TPA: hypothetical protein VGK70_05605, partial [Thermoanaerobaculia bacterium]